MHLVLVVLDGLSPRHATPLLTPNLHRLANGCGERPSLGIGCLLSASVPALATLLTGRTTAEHGLWASRVWADGDFVPAASVGPVGLSLLDAWQAAGRSYAAVVPEPLPLVGPAVAPHGGPVIWGRPAESVPRPGGPPDEDVVASFDRMADDALPELALIHLGGPDEAGHALGPDSEGAYDSYRRTDRTLATLVERYAPVWGDTVMVAISDHGMETVLEPEPIDVAAAAAVAGLPWRVHAEGSGALAVWAGLGEPADTAFTALAGVEGDIEVNRGVRLLWSSLGRRFGEPDDPVPCGVHGGPRSIGQVVAVGGGHLAARPLARIAARDSVPAAAWAPTLAALAGIDLPTATAVPLVRTGGGTPPQNLGGVPACPSRTG